MPTFRKKPLEIEAMQWDGDWDSYLRLGAWVGDSIEWHPASTHSLFEDGTTGETVSIKRDTPLPVRVKLYVAANDAWLVLEAGEWVIRDSRGFYPCKPDIFAATYDPA